MTAVGEHQVTSEIFSGMTVGPPGSEGYVTTKFYFRRPADPIAEAGQKQEAVEYDSDGDLILKRKGSEDVVHIKHSASTSLRMVGLQVWRGALLLADWALHYGPSLLRGATVLELGTGTGLTSIVAAMHAKEVVSTDVDLAGLLDLIKANIDLNRRLVKAKSTVLGLDFFSKEWSKEVMNKLTEVSVILAADVIYDVDLTEAFVESLVKIMNVKPKKTLYFALEKR
ncbi:hypothetical protein FOCC_FOCC008874 [Frankliniella occidentalis]|nr:hypothetical protein FOCC_FOCC008874 [Frankliniella occidentalis]